MLLGLQPGQDRIWHPNSLSMDFPKQSHIIRLDSYIHSYFHDHNVFLIIHWHVEIFKTCEHGGMLLTAMKAHLCLNAFTIQLVSRQGCCFLPLHYTGCSTPSCPHHPCPVTSPWGLSNPMSSFHYPGHLSNRVRKHQLGAMMTWVKAACWR